MRAFDATAFELVVSDIDLPGHDGIMLLRTIRQRAPDVPVILLTGRPRLDTAILAIEHRATRYMQKPVDHGAFKHAARVSMHARRLAQVRRDLGELGDGALDSRQLEGNFERALEQLFMVYQPIVRWSDRSVYSHEALVRSREPSLGNPARSSTRLTGSTEFTTSAASCARSRHVHYSTPRTASSS